MNDMNRPKKSDITKERILAAAEAEFSQNGFDATRMDAIAQRANVNKERIYAYFRSKETLYITVLERLYQRIDAYETVLASLSFEGTETLRQAVAEYFSFLSQNPAFVRLIMWENLHDASYAKQVNTTLFRGIETILREGVARGVFRSDLDIEQTVISVNLFCFSAFSNNKTLSALCGTSFDSEEALSTRAKHIADLLIRYVT